MTKKLDKISSVIQGGMGAAVSGYRLANVVSRLGGTGVVSGTALDEVMIRRMQVGGKEAERIVETIKAFPDKEFGSKVIDRYYLKDGLNGERFKRSPFPQFEKINDEVFRIENSELEKLIVLSNFVEVKLAKEGHNNPVGINYLYKIQWSIVPSIYGAMIAGVDALMIGAGFPREIPEVLERLKENKEVLMQIPVKDSKREHFIYFNPQDYDFDVGLERPLFFGIVANHLGVKGLSNVDAYVLENYIAGGHNAPARDKNLTEKGEPRYGKKDDINYKLLSGLLDRNREQRGFEQPFWLAGGYASKLNEAISLGARGVQVGTPFAYCLESGIESRLKRRILKEIVEGAEVFTDPFASPSGFPFKIIKAKGTIAEDSEYSKRKRVCNLGYLVDLYESDDKIMTRCPAEPTSAYVSKGGELSDTEKRMCLCNGLLATIGLNSNGELPLVTSGSDLLSVREIVEKYGFDYSARDVLDYING